MRQALQIWRICSVNIQVSDKTLAFTTIALMQAYAVVEYAPTALYAVFMQHHSTRMRRFCIPSYEKAHLYLRVIPILLPSIYVWGPGR